MACLRDYFGSGVMLDGRFETIAPLNHGSFGMVFMARDHKTNETVAVKCLTKKSAPSNAGLAFVVDEKSEELILHRRLGMHPNIVNLIHSFETDAHIYLVLEFCSRGDLYEAIRSGQGPLETERVRQFMLELVDAVSYSHSKGVYHRDIKPENIFLTKSGAVKLGDFGLATMEKWTSEGMVGSDRYMSPEQYDSAGAGYSPAQADIWAIGVCLLNILFSRNPFTSPTESDPLFLDFSRDKQSLFDVFPSMSQDTYEVIVQCMNLDPKKRSLIGARAALLRVVSFTTLDEALDDFCSSDRKVGATSNREPLRTPSIQSPLTDHDAFPWTRAQIRPLSAIPDDESYTEDMFSQSEGMHDWCSGTIQTPSIASVVDSALGVSFKSSHLSGRLINKPARGSAKVSPTAGSLPISVAKPRVMASANAPGVRRQCFSKSWGDMWEKDIEEEQEEEHISNGHVHNGRGWGQETRVDDWRARRGNRSPAHKVETTPRRYVGNSVALDDYFGGDSQLGRSVHPSPARYSPPHRRAHLDKWAALGERRRAHC